MPKCCYDLLEDKPQVHHAEPYLIVKTSSPNAIRNKFVLHAKVV